MKLKARIVNEFGLDNQTKLKIKTKTFQLTHLVPTRAIGMW